jgi:hypothetical protein
VLTHLKKFYGKEKKRNLVLIHENDSFDSPFIPFDSFPLDKLVHDYCFTIYYNGNNPITFKSPDDLLEEARKISKEKNIPENVWMPHFKAFYKEKMKDYKNNIYNLVKNKLENNTSFNLFYEHITNDLINKFVIEKNVMNNGAEKLIATTCANGNN